MAESNNGQANAQQAGFAGVTRKTLERLALPGDQREFVVAEVTYPPGGVAPLHRPHQQVAHVYDEGGEDDEHQRDGVSPHVDGDEL